MKNPVIPATMAVMLAVAAIGVACGGDSVPKPPLPKPTPASVAQAAPESTPTSPAAKPTQPSAPKPEVTPGPAVVQIALASTDLSVGTNRVGFALIDTTSGAVTDAQVKVESFRLTSDGPEGPIETASAVFRRWPVGPGGIYITHLSFDTEGSWGIGITAEDTEGSTKLGSARIEVRASSVTPAIGSPAPRSASKTFGDVTGLDQLTTDPDPDPDMYSKTIAEALDLDVPLMVSFASPAYCQTQTCGPQLDVIKALKTRYQDRMSFIHIEVYDNPDEIEGDLTRAVVSPTVTEWNLPSEPWTFIIDAEGIVQAKFEGFVTSEELEQALGDVLD